MEIQCGLLSNKYICECFPNVIWNLRAGFDEPSYIVTPAVHACCRHGLGAGISVGRFSEFLPPQYIRWCKSDRQFINAETQGICHGSAQPVMLYHALHSRDIEPQERRCYDDRYSFTIYVI